MLDVLTIVILGSGLYLWIARRRNVQEQAGASPGLRAVAGEAAE